MAKKKKILPPPALHPPSFYAYYDELGNIISISNEKLEMYTNSLEITFEIYQKFTRHKNKFSDFKVENNELICIKIDQSPATVINLKPIKLDLNPDIQIYCHSEWTFLLTDFARQRYYTGKINTNSVILFLTLESDRNYLIRTFNLNFRDLVLNKIVVPFDGNLETSNNWSLLTSSDLSFNIDVKETK